MNYDYKSIWHISFPIIVSLILTQLITVTDVIYLGHFNTIAVAATGLSGVYYFALFMLFSGFGLGAQIIISRRNGQKKYKSIGAVFYQGLSFLLLSALVMIVLSYFISPVILKMLISDDSVFEAGLIYLNWRILGLVAAAFLVMLRGFFIGIAKTFALQLISVTMLCLNVVLNYVFIFGFKCIPSLGIKGAAIASVISEILAVLVCLIYLILKVDVVKYGFKTFVYKNTLLLKSILNLSVWTMLQQFMSVCTWFLFFVAVEHLGVEEIAIANILRNSAGIPWIVVIAFGSAASTVTGNLIGEGRQNEVLKANRNIIFLNTCCIVMLLVVFACFYHPILSIYSNDTHLINKAIYPYFSALLCYLPLFSGLIWFQNVSATGYAKYSMFIEFVAMIFYMLFVGVFIYKLQVPLYICMQADGVYNLVLFVMSRHFMHTSKWRDKAI